jgi:hypothetical protein
MPSTVIDRDNETTTASRRARGAPAHGDKGGPLERITVNLIARAARALRAVSELTGDSRTDSVNRAIQVYAYVMQVDVNGGGIYVRESADAEVQRLKMF